MHNVFLLLGSNMGNSLNLIKYASEEISQRIGKITKKSSVYKSEPWGFIAETFFLNQVIKVTTELTPDLILDAILKIEDKLGRKRTQSNYESRTIDIDILFYDNLQLDTPRLTIPHPKIGERRFVLVPLNELEPEKYHPVLQINMKELLWICPDRLKVERLVE